VFHRHGPLDEVDEFVERHFSDTLASRRKDRIGERRTLSPVVERFLVCVREVAASFAGKPAARAARPRVRKPNGR
jgi:hypothetical protein